MASVGDGKARDLQFALDGLLSAQNRAPLAPAGVPFVDDELRIVDQRENVVPSSDAIQVSAVRWLGHDDRGAPFVKNKSPALSIVLAPNQAFQMFIQTSLLSVGSQKVSVSKTQTIVGQVITISRRPPRQ